MNYNLQVVASADAAHQDLGTQQNTTGPVNDFISGANVSGTEWTTTDVSVELRPGQDAANLDLILNWHHPKQHRRLDLRGEHLFAGLPPLGREESDPLRRNVDHDRPG